MPRLMPLSGTKAESTGDLGGSAVGSELGHGDIDFDEDALARAGLGSMHNGGDVAMADPCKAAGAAGVVEWLTILCDVGNPIFELNEDVRAVIDADAITGTEVLIDPNSHDVSER